MQRSPKCRKSTEFFQKQLPTTEQWLSLQRSCEATLLSVIIGLCGQVDSHTLQYTSRTEDMATPFTSTTLTSLISVALYPTLRDWGVACISNYSAICHSGLYTMWKLTSKYLAKAERNNFLGGGIKFLKVR